MYVKFTLHLRGSFAIVTQRYNSPHIILKTISYHIPIISHRVPYYIYVLSHVSRETFTIVSRFTFLSNIVSPCYNYYFLLFLSLYYIIINTISYSLAYHLAYTLSSPSSVPCNIYIFFTFA